MPQPEILVINPNTSREISERIRTVAVEEAGHATLIRMATAGFGARYIASRVSVAIAGVAVLEAYAAALAEGATPQAVVIACFGDPGLAALSEIADVPVFGFAACGLAAAAARPGPFAIATIGSAWRDMLQEQALLQGHADRLAGFIELDAITRAPAAARAIIAQQAARLGVDRVVLGGTGLIPAIDEIARGLRVEVVDPHRSALRLAVASVSRQQQWRRTALHPGGTFSGLSAALTAVLGEDATSAA